MKNFLVPFVLLFLAGTVLFAGCSQSQVPVTPSPTPAPVPPTVPATPTPPPDTVTVAANPQYGQILADMNGRTLYYFLRDVPGNGTSACNGACAALWPPFNTGKVQVSPPLQAADFVTITRADGTFQITWKGWPLYYFSGDKAAGDTNGYGFNKLWYVLSPGGVVTLAPTTTVPTTAPPTTVPTIVPTTVPTTYSSMGGGGY